MYRLTLTENQRLELHRRAHQPGIAPSFRDRLEMVRLCDAGWRIPHIAQHLRQHQQTVRAWIKAFCANGFDALHDKPRGGKISALTPQILEAVCQEVSASGRTWNAKQIADWIAQRYGVGRTPAQVRRKLRKARLSYKRTGRSLRHKQKPDEVAAKKSELATLEKGGSAPS